MDISFFDFFKSAVSSPPTLTAALLTLGVIFVNGWTDAPNAIVSCVCSKTLSMKKAVFTAAVCNLAGVLIMTFINSSVAKNIFECADFSSSEYGHAALCAALASVIILAVGAWVFGIPTSESHAIISALIGAAAACGATVKLRVIAYTFIGLILSVAGGFIIGYYLFSHMKRKTYKKKKLERLQILGAVLMSFMHGAQDGQKFISIFLVAISLQSPGSQSGTDFCIPVWTALLCSLTMACGTALGGGRIIRTVGKKMVRLNLKQGVCADIAGSISLFLSTCLGLPVSTTHAKTSSVMGCGFVDSALDSRTAFEMLAAWIITFPACFIMGYVFTRLAM